MVLFRINQDPGVYEINYVGRYDYMLPGSVVHTITSPASSDAAIHDLINLALRDAIDNGGT